MLGSLWAAWLILPGFPSGLLLTFVCHTQHTVWIEGAVIVSPDLQSPSTGRHRNRKYGRRRAALPLPSGFIGDASSRGAVDLMADLRALINAGLIKPYLDGWTIRYAVVDADNADAAGSVGRQGAPHEQQR
jgi:hypothetical protein